MKIASYFIKQNNDRVICELCPHRCKISPDQSGICGVRQNIKGNLIARTYERISALNMDPIEKKPLYHFYPNRNILSVGSIGCNLKCSFCQNWSISQIEEKDFLQLKTYSSQQLLQVALKQSNNIGIAYTYNEPIVNFEMVAETAELFHKHGLKNVLVSNAYICLEPLKELIPLIDAFNIDLKAFTDDFYRKHTASMLEPVLQSLSLIKKMNKHLELTFLAIPQLNDDLVVFDKMIQWITKELGSNTVLHISKYFPNYRLNNPPTPEALLYRMYEIAKTRLSFVYLGNIISTEASNTYCPICRAELVRRKGYSVEFIHLDSNGNCKQCGEKVIDFI